MTGLVVALVDSLLTAMVRADGDALVMHVGERPIVVSGSRTIDLSAHGMNLSAMVGMLGQLLSGDALSALKELGAVEHALPARGEDHFSVVAARSGDDIWIEIRRRREGADTALSHAGVAAPAPKAQSPAAAVAVEATRVEAPPAHEPAAGVHEGPSAGSAAVAARASEVPAGSPAVTVDEPPAAAAAPSELSDSVEVVAAAAAEAPEAAREVPATITEPEPSEPAAAQATAAVESSPSEPEEPASVAEATPMPELVASAATATPPAEPVEVAAEQEPTESVSAPEVAPKAEPTEQEHVEPAWSAASMGTESSAQMEDVSTHVPVLATSGLAETAAPSAAASQVKPMEPVRHSGPPADIPPPRLTPPAPPPAGPVAENGSSAPDAPVTRTVRIEVPARAVPSSRATGIDRLLRAADAAGASELFVMSQARPYVRVAGHVRPLQEEASLLGADVESLVADVTPEPWRDAVRRGDPAEWLIELAEIGRVRCSTFRDHRGPGANFHFAFLRATTADDLQLSEDMRRLATEPDGLVLVAGAANQDAAAIVAAFVGILNSQRADYIITLEPHIRVSHVSRTALVSQREVGHDSARAVAAARAALREQPDGLVIEGVDSGDMAQIVIEAAQERLVIASMDAPSAVTAVQRLVELVPAEQRAAARAALARRFRGAIAQLLLRKVSGGRIAAREVLSGTRPVVELLASGDLARLAEPLEAAGATGMAPLADAIVDYVCTGVVDVREAARKAPDPNRLLTRLKAAGVDVSSVEVRG